MDKRPRIFVSIAAYRDPECRWTIENLFDKARFPDRIFVGICWQFLADQDAELFPVRSRPTQCRLIEVDARGSKGACWARHQVQRLWHQEAYTLQIDSHMRFVPDWDEKMIAILGKCPSDRPVLSSYPPGYVPPDVLDKNAAVYTINADRFDADGFLWCAGDGVVAEHAPREPQPNPFVAAGFLFADGRINEDVPYDPHIYFQGEEQTLAVRLWTHGWDIFVPNEVLLYHWYNIDDRPHVSQNNEHWRLHERSLKRVRHLLGMESSDDPEVMKDMELYGLGHCRSLADYEAFSGVDFRRRLINGKTMAERDAAAPLEEKRRRMCQAFQLLWRTNAWGGAPETRSGIGSTLAATECLRQNLRKIFSDLDIKSLTDAGCGDCNWIGEVSQCLRLYLGLDVVHQLVDELRQRYAGRSGHFFACSDITLDALPRSDAILCRDVLPHLPDEAVFSVLERVKASGSRYFIASTYEGIANRPGELGGWRPMDLTAAPFHLPRPLIVVPENIYPTWRKVLGVWPIKDLP